MPDTPIISLQPRGDGHQFAFYGDSCSGVPGALHETNLARINAVVRRLHPAPEFIVFPGDEVIGLTPDEAGLRAQWQHFLQTEMDWHDGAAMPIYHCTGNHTTYDRMSERVFADVMAHQPRNGPADQQGLSYFVRDGDLLLVVVNTCWSRLGGEGNLELDWLRRTLRDHGDAARKFVVGHHPAFPVNGYVGQFQRTIGDAYVDDFWTCLTESGVIAYLCSHILAFDVQCHRGVLQITSAGAGTAHRMPEGVEYLHCVQMAVDGAGLRYQVLDQDGHRRESLSWPPDAPARLAALAGGINACDWAGECPAVCVQVSGDVHGTGPRQTLLAAMDADGRCPLWIGTGGPQGHLIVSLQPETGRSPHQWLGPCLTGGRFELDLLLHPGMGPGGILWRVTGTPDWTGLTGASAWGMERIVWPQNLWVGAMGTADRDTCFAGTDLSVQMGAGPP